MGTLGTRGDQATEQTGHPERSLPVTQVHLCELQRAGEQLSVPLLRPEPRRTCGPFVWPKLPAVATRPVTASRGATASGRARRRAHAARVPGGPAHSFVHSPGDAAPLAGAAEGGAWSAASAAPGQGSVLGSRGAAAGSPSCCECGLMRKEGLCRCSQVGGRSDRVTCVLLSRGDARRRPGHSGHVTMGGARRSPSWHPWKRREAGQLRCRSHGSTASARP